MVDDLDLTERHKLMEGNRLDEMKKKMSGWRDDLRKVEAYSRGLDGIKEQEGLYRGLNSVLGEVYAAGDGFWEYWEEVKGGADAVDKEEREWIINGRDRCKKESYLVPYWGSFRWEDNNPFCLISGCEDRLYREVAGEYCLLRLKLEDRVREIHKILGLIGSLPVDVVPAWEGVGVEGDVGLLEGFCSVLCGDWFDGFSTDRGRYTPEWRRGIVERLMRVDVSTGLSRDWKNKDSRVKLVCQMIGALHGEGVLKGAKIGIGRAMVEGSVFSKLSGREYKPDTLKDYIKVEEDEPMYRDWLRGELKNG